MNDLIKIHNIIDESEVCYPYKSLIFPGGEPHVQVDPQYITDKNIWIDARICSANGFMTLLALLDAINTCNPRRLGLFIPYFPGARQDRYESGYAFSLKIYGHAIRRYSLHSILVFDPHSSVLKSIVDTDIITSHEVIVPTEFKYDAIVCPDNGARNRALDFAKASGVGINKVLFCYKTRDPETGKLSGFQVSKNHNLKSGRFLVVDDICDGGGTFLGLADEVCKHYPDCTLDLYVSHGIFSNGFHELEKRFSQIITTDSFPRKDQPGEWCYSHLVKYKPLWYHAAHFMKERLNGSL